MYTGCTKDFAQSLVMVIQPPLVVSKLLSQLVTKPSAQALTTMPPLCQMNYQNHIDTLLFENQISIEQFHVTSFSVAKCVAFVCPGQVLEKLYILLPFHCTVINSQTTLLLIIVYHQIHTRITGLFLDCPQKFCLLTHAFLKQVDP